MDVKEYQELKNEIEAQKKRKIEFEVQLSSAKNELKKLEDDLAAEGLDSKEKLEEEIKALEQEIQNSVQTVHNQVLESRQALDEISIKLQTTDA